MFKYLSAAIVILVLPSTANANGFGTVYGDSLVYDVNTLIRIAEAKTGEFCMYDGTHYTKGAILQIEGQPSLICAAGLHAPLVVSKNRPLEWVDYDAWKEARQ